MICAYDKVYLEKARTALGRMLDFAVYELEYDMEAFFQLFISTGIALRFETGDFTVLVGMSGVELAYLVLEQAGIEKERIRPRYTANRSQEYWTGWALAYYQWITSLHFSQIVERVPIKKIQALYYPFHEMDIRQFAEQMEQLYQDAGAETNLKRRRRRSGLTQRQLAELSGVPLRTIQQYEQRQKNINKAQAEYLMSLSRALCCYPEELMERTGEKL